MCEVETERVNFLFNILIYVRGGGETWSLAQYMKWRLWKTQTGNTDEKEMCSEKNLGDKF